MENYVVTFSGWREPSGDIYEFGTFRVAAGRISFPTRFMMTGTLYAVIRSHTNPPPPREFIRQRMLAVGLPRLRAKLDDMELPEASTDTFLLTESFGSEATEVFLTPKGERRCTFQEKKPRGLFCAAASDDDNLGGKTTRALCLQCDLPDDLIRCTNLQHPVVIGAHSYDIAGRRVSSAFCDIQTVVFDHRKCVPGGHDCWRQEVQQSDLPEEIPGDIAERVVDEIQFLSLSFWQAFGHGLLRISDPRSVVQLTLPCKGQEGFTANIACLADILNSFDLAWCDQEIGSDRKGSLLRLAKFLKGRSALVDERPIEQLRQVVAIRNSFPIHSDNTKFLVACEALHLSYPFESWAGAWRLILFRAWSALRVLRTSVKSISGAGE